KLVDLKINKEAVDPDDIDMLQDLVVAAINDGMTKVNEATQQTLGKYTRGMGM
ncbi:MAG: YbaB/EbfC family nucleoid-associated protein, partial [Limosilactobacillus sp.]